jgi:hypothetical protein
VHHRVGPGLLHRILDVASILEITFDQCRARIDREPMSLREVVENRDLMPRVEKLLDVDTANIPGAAGDEYVHGE